MAQIYGQEADPVTVRDFVIHFVTQNHIKAKQGKRKTTICIWGPKGIGKTDLVKQLAGTDIADRVIDIPIAQIEEMGDFHGLPIHKEQDGRTVTVTAPPHWIPVDPDEKSIVLIDDFNRADLRIIRGIMQLIQDHKTISWSLPPLCSIVLTANPADDEYLVTSLDPAILSRMAHIHMVPEFRAWLAWGEKNEVDPRILSFIARYHEQLAPSGAERTCPRGWHMYSDAIRSLSVVSNEANIKLLKLFGLAVIDEDVVSSFIRFMEGDFDKVIEPEVIVTSYLKNEEIRKKLLKMSQDGRIDILNVTMERLVAYVNNLQRVTSGSDTQKNVIGLLEEDYIPKDMKHLYVNLLANGPMANHIISSKLAIQLRQVV